ncbi:MAG: MMPL family transporter, partial [Halobacteriovoraceae bacterium]|nr:MMPL family transporter [Halobacteriovoraceae bacterium]
NFSKREEQNIEGVIYSHLILSREDSKDLFRKLLVRLPSQQLSEWMLENLQKDQGPHLKEVSELDDPDPGFISNSFEAIICLLYKKPWLTVLLLILLSLFPLSQLPHIVVDPSLERILVKDSPQMKIYKESLSLFGADKSVIILIRDPKIFTNEKLKPLRKLAWDFQKWQDIERVNSVFTSSFIRSEEDTLYTEPLFESLPYKQNLLELVQEDPLLHGRLVDVPKNTLVFVLKLNKEIQGMHKIAKKVEEKIAPLKGNYQIFFQTGEPSIENFQTKEMADSSKIFLPLIALILFLGFYFFVRSIHAFVITVFATGMSLMWSFGIMTWLGIPIQIMIVLIPGITLTLSATEIVHMATSLRTAWFKGHRGVNALSYMSQDIGKAIFLTFTSTALGFLSIRISEILLLQEFAIVAFLSLSFVFVLTLLYLPLHFSIYDRFLSKKGTDHNSYLETLKDLPFFYTLREKFYLFYLNSFFSKTAISLMALFVLSHLYFATKVRMDNDTFEMISDRTVVKKNLNTFKNEIGGMKEIHLVLESQKQILTPNTLKRIWDIHLQLDKMEQTKNTQSIAGVLSLLNKEMRSGDQKDYGIPKSQNLIDQYMLSLSRDDFDPYLSPDKHKTNIRISHDISSSVKTEQYIEKVNQLVESNIENSDLTYYLTSRNILNIHAGNTIIKSQALSLITMSIVILSLMTFFFKSFRVGLIALIPNLVPIIGLFGIMGIFDVPLNVGTCIVAAITIGIAADDTIHLFSRYFKDRLLDSNPFHTGRESINEELTPILTTSLSLSLSFSTFIFANFIPMLQFGLLSAYVLILAVVSDLYLGPWILTFFDLKKSKAKGHQFTY